MKFESEASAPIVDPSELEIRDGIEKINGKENNFAILSIDEMTYIQTVGSPSAGFRLEYQNGSLDDRWKTSGRAVSQSEAIAAFLSYRNQDEHWKQKLHWEKGDLSAGDTQKSSGGCLSLIVLAAGALGTLMILGMRLA